MSNPYIEYYNNQIGSGLVGFQGVRTQRGHGFFGRIFGGIGNFIKSLAPSLFKSALPSAIGLAQDVMEGKNVGESAKSRLVDAGKNVASTTLDHLKTRIQGGSGIYRYHYFKKRKLPNKKTGSAKRRKRSKKKVYNRKSSTKKW